MLRTCGLVIAGALLLTACDGGDIGAGVSQADTPPPPRALQYGLGTGEAGMPFGPYAPSVIGTVTAYSVSPALPAGLTLDPKSGVISGTPQTGSNAAYTVSASNAGGSTTLTLSVVVLVPPTVAYATPATATLGMALTPLTPTLTGDADAYYVVPSLPDGLALDPKTGIISGTPSRPRVAVTYTVVASNVGGAYTSADLVLGVDPGPAGTAVTGVFRGETVSGLGYRSGIHGGLTDSSGAFTYEVGQGIAFSVGTVNIGAVPSARALVTPVDLVAGGSGTSSHVLNVVRFLMMLDQDGNANNGIQISPAVSAAAASWAPVDFDTADLPTTLAALIQQASAADGVPHVLPDAASAQAHLRSGFFCNRAGFYVGTFAADSSPNQHSDFTAYISPDGSMHSVAFPGIQLTGFDVQTSDALSPALDASFAQSAPQSATSVAVDLTGHFADAAVLLGTYLTDAAGGFQAVADRSVAATYKFSGTYALTPKDPTTGSPSTGAVHFGMDDANQVFGGAFFGTLSGTVSGTTFTGMVSVRPDPYSRRTVQYPVSGTYSNTAAGVTLSGQYDMPNSVVTFSTIGCRAN